MKKRRRRGEALCLSVHTSAVCVLPTVPEVKWTTQTLTKTIQDPRWITEESLLVSVSALPFRNSRSEASCSLGSFFPQSRKNWTHFSQT